MDSRAPSPDFSMARRASDSGAAAPTGQRNMALPAFLDCRDSSPRRRRLCRVPSFCLVLLACLFAISAWAPRGFAQCTAQWLPGHGYPGARGNVHATTMWDPDGPGSAQPVLVVGGQFEVAGTSPSRSVVTYDPGSGAWTALGLGLSLNGLAGIVDAVTTLPNGDLVVGGEFVKAGFARANCIARWDGSAWSALGSGLNAGVSALTTLPNGDLVAGGRFTTAGGVGANRIARWDGSSWSALGLGTTAQVRALTTLPNGDLVAGGDFGRPVRWDGSTWSPIGSRFNAGSVCALATLPNGDLVGWGEAS